MTEARDLIFKRARWPGLPGPRVSAFGTIHPELFRFSTPLGSGSPRDRIRLASLEPQVGFDVPANGWGMLTDTSACRNALFDERFAALDDCPASFDNRFASDDDRQSSFNESLASAMEVLANSLRLPPDREVQMKRADVPPKATVSKVDVRLAQPRNEVPQPRKEISPLEEDGRIAIYDITARTVYLPNGRRLEAHSGFGDLMDNPRHVNVRMQGATPPNVYKLTLREQLFHGVRAIRLNPVEGGRMYGRTGILAHSYMLGPNGQSNGCVSFNDYPEFLNAFLRGEVARLVVVERLESPPRKFAAGQPTDRGRDELKADRSVQYAAASY